MKKQFKFINLFMFVIILSAFSCDNDDDASIEINLEDLEVTIDENPTNGDIVGTVLSNSNNTLTFSITTQTPSGALNIDTSTGELTVADATQFDYEINPIITATVDADEAENTATITISVNNVNELNVQDFTVTINENPTDGQVLGTVLADGDGTLSYSLSSQTPSGSLSIDSATGELTVVDPNLFDFETNPVITAIVTVDNSVSTATATVTVNLNDVDEVSAQSVNLNIDENPSNGDVVGFLPATGSNLTYTITFQNPAGAFNINQNTGELTVADETLFDFETNPNMLATISVSNGTQSVSANAMVDLNDLNEIGEYKHGGVIFWIDPMSNNSEGLVVSMSDLSNSAEYGCTNTSTGATGFDIGDGQTNTTTILAVCTTSGIAADLANSFNSNGFNDWFLPSVWEFNEIRINLSVVNTALTANGGTALSSTSAGYWTSTEENNAEARFYYPTPPNTNFFPKHPKFNNKSVRAVRAWTDF